MPHGVSCTCSKKRKEINLIRSLWRSSPKKNDIWRTSTKSVETSNSTGAKISYLATSLVCRPLENTKDSINTACPTQAQTAICTAPISSNSFREIWSCSSNNSTTWTASSINKKLAASISKTCGRDKNLITLITWTTWIKICKTNPKFKKDAILIPPSTWCPYTSQRTSTDTENA